MGKVTLCPGRVVARWYHEEETVWPASVHDLAKYFFYAVEIDPEFTFGDLCQLLDREGAELLEVVLGEHVVPLLEEARLPAESFESTRIDFLRVRNAHEDGQLGREFDGWGPWDEPYEGAWEKDPDCPRKGPISVGLVRANQLLDLSLRYDPELVFRDSAGVEEYRSSVDITLIEFLKAIFFELTFYGLPAERDQVRADLQRRVEEIEQGPRPGAAGAGAGGRRAVRHGSPSHRAARSVSTQPLPPRGSLTSLFPGDDVDVGVGRPRIK